MKTRPMLTLAGVQSHQDEQIAQAGIDALLK